MPGGCELLLTNECANVLLAPKYPGNDFSRYNAQTQTLHFYFIFIFLTLLFSHSFQSKNMRLLSKDPVSSFIFSDILWNSSFAITTKSASSRFSILAFSA